MDALVIYSLAGNREVIDSLKNIQAGRENGLACFSEGKGKTRLCMSDL